MNGTVIFIFGDTTVVVRREEIFLVTSKLAVDQIDIMNHHGITVTIDLDDDNAFAAERDYLRGKGLGMGSGIAYWRLVKSEEEDADPSHRWQREVSFP
jgi:hypothetical protein